jgi:hypothetical protein
VLGLSELVVPGEDSRNKQLREIQQLLASAPIVVAAPGSYRVAPGFSPASSAERAGATLRDGATGNDEAVAQQSPVTDHQSPILVLPSVPVDELLDDHAVEFEECKRWANSDAGQAARMSNPVGFANVRAHAQAHLRVMAGTSQQS